MIEYAGLQTTAKGVDALLSTAPPKGMTEVQLDQWYRCAMQYLAEIEAEQPALYREREPAIEDDYSWIRTGC
jgi:hypothetical protein